MEHQPTVAGYVVDSPVQEPNDTRLARSSRAADTRVQIYGTRLLSLADCEAIHNQSVMHT